MRKSMWTGGPLWRRMASNERAVANARTASIELSRRRVEREEVELYLRARRVAMTRLPDVVRPA